MGPRDDWFFSDMRQGYVYRDTDRFVPFERVLRVGLARGFERRVQIAGEQYAWNWLCEQLDWLAFGRARPCPCCGGQQVIQMEGYEPRSCLVCGGLGFGMPGSRLERRE